MSYVNAYEILPADLIKEIQKYADGKTVYIPRKDDIAISWGEMSGTKDKLAKRNKKIVGQYYSGATITELSSAFFLSEKRIQGIIREYESSNDSNGGFKK